MDSVTAMEAASHLQASALQQTETVSPIAIDVNNKEDEPPLFKTDVFVLADQITRKSSKIHS